MVMVSMLSCLLPIATRSEFIYPTQSERIVCLPQMVYDKVLPVYFPRTKAEQEWATPIIPADIGRPHPLGYYGNDL